MAGDEQSYETFAELLDPVIDGRHNGYPKNAIHRLYFVILLSITKINSQITCNLHFQSAN